MTVDAAQTVTFDKGTTANLLRRINARVTGSIQRVFDGIRVARIRLGHCWPCMRHQVVVVGSESSGTTIIARMLHGFRNGRYLVEGKEHWVWQAYMRVYSGAARVEDYPRLQLFDFVKVPGFAAILPQYAQAFPLARFVYVVRDPRDVLLSAIRTFGVTSYDDLFKINWISQTWLGIREQDPVERLAMRWLLYLRTARSLASPPIFVRYEDFFHDRVQSVRNIAKAMSLSFDPNVAEALAVRQASHASVRAYEPAGPRQQDAHSFLPADAFDRMLAICSSEMASFGYTR